MESDDRSLISVLTRDHRRIANLLARLVTRGVDRRQLADEVTSVLIRHMVAEELYLYPVVREVLPEYAVDVAHHLGIDARVEQILADLTAVEPDSNPFDALITKLIAEASRAILHEELDVFPLLAQHGDRQTLTGLGDMVKAFEDATVVEKTSCGGLAIRFGDRVIHRWVPAALVD